MKLAWMVVFCTLVACARESSPSVNAATSSSAPTSSVAPAPAAPATSASSSPTTARAVRIEAPADAEVATLIRLERARATKAGNTLLVEVGAGWCKPCKTLKEALAKGELDGVLSGVTILAFDADVHGPRLDSLGYSSKFVPYFAVPKPDGRASEHQLDAKIPKDASAKDIAAQLEPLLRATRSN